MIFMNVDHSFGMFIDQGSVGVSATILSMHFCSTAYSLLPLSIPLKKKLQYEVIKLINDIQGPKNWVSFPLFLKPIIGMPYMKLKNKFIKP